MVKFKENKYFKNIEDKFMTKLEYMKIFQKYLKPYLLYLLLIFQLLSIVNKNSAIHI